MKFPAQLRQYNTQDEVLDLHGNRVPMKEFSRHVRREIRCMKKLVDKHHNIMLIKPKTLEGKYKDFDVVIRCGGCGTALNSPCDLAHECD